MNSIFEILQPAASAPVLRTFPNLCQAKVLCPAKPQNLWEDIFLSLPEIAGYQAEAIEPAPVEAYEQPAEEVMMAEAVAVDQETAGTTIMEQPAEYFTLQVIASVDIDRVLRFTEQKQFSTQYIVATERDGIIWHILLLDVYADYAMAVAARDEVSPSLKDQPWIRTVGSVQKLAR